jgi:hypothetical protein
LNVYGPAPLIVASPLKRTLVGEVTIQSIAELFRASISRYDPGRRLKDRNFRSRAA